MSSCIYNGVVTHTRLKPVKHHLKYKTFSIFLDLDEIDKLDKSNPIFSFNRFNIFSFYNKDHGARDGKSLKSWVINNLKKFNIHQNVNKVKLLCYPRIFGYVFNPLSIFFIYNKIADPIAIFYEVKNTFGEQHTYIFEIKNTNSQIKNDCKKKFFVSPFMDLESKYFFKVILPDEKFSVIIDQRDKEGKLLFASQDGDRHDFTLKNLLFCYLKHPLMSFKVISAIHYEALKLWIKGVKLVKRSIKIKNNSTFEN